MEDELSEPVQRVGCLWLWHKSSHLAQDARSEKGKRSREEQMMRNKQINNSSSK